MSTKLARRVVVTGHDARGRSRVASDTTVSGQEVPGIPGFECSQIWGSNTRMHYPDEGKKPSYTEFFPPLEGFRLIESYIPPRTAAAPDTSEGSESAAGMKASIPGLADTLDQERPGMHRTPTTDVIIVLEGRCILELDDGRVELVAGDLVIQSGTIHAWSNPYDEPCRFLATVVGARNDLCS